MTFIYAHRGSAGTHPENTMDAFIAAKQAKADGIELDVQLTSDEEIVVIHDLTVDRTTNGTGAVRDFTLEELSQLNASYVFQGQARIPALRDVFNWLKGNNLLCNIELKNSQKPYEGLEERVVQLIKEFSYEKRMILSSFNHASLVHCKKIAPEIETGLLCKRIPKKPWEYAMSLNASAIHPKYSSLSIGTIQKTLEKGIAVRPYTVNDEKVMKKLFQANCVAIITDYPEKAFHIRELIN